MKVFIMRGVSGSGKSTLAGKIAAVTGGEVVSADAYFHLPKASGTDRDGGQFPDREYDFNPSELGYAHAYSMRRFIAALAARRSGLPDGADVIVDNTNTTAPEIAPYLLVAQSYRADVVIIQVRCDVATAIRRATHGAPSHVIEAMSARLAEPLPPYWPQEIAVDGDLPLDVFEDLSEVPAAGGMSILETRGNVTSVVYDDAPYAGYRDDGGDWVYTRQAIVIG